MAITMLVVGFTVITAAAPGALNASACSPWPLLTFPTFNQNIGEVHINEHDYVFDAISLAPTLAQSTSYDDDLDKLFPVCTAQVWFADAHLKVSLYCPLPAPPHPTGDLSTHTSLSNMRDDTSDTHDAMTPSIIAPNSPDGLPHAVGIYHDQIERLIAYVMTHNRSTTTTTTTIVNEPCRDTPASSSTSLPLIPHGPFRDASAAASTSLSLIPTHMERQNGQPIVLYKGAVQDVPPMLNVGVKLRKIYIDPDEPTMGFNSSLL